jgi:hypothetical protein
LAFQKRGFRGCLNQGEEQEKLRDLLTAKLGAVPQKLRTLLADKLNVAAELSCEDLEADHREALKALNLLSEDAGLDDRTPLQELAAAIAVCFQSNRLLSTSGSRDTVGQSALDASSPFGTEISLAARDRRLPEHRPKQSEGDLPRGRLCLDVPPEEGRNADFDLDVGDIEKLTGADIAQALERSDAKVRSPKPWLRNREELGKPRYYLAVPAKGETGKAACEKLAEDTAKEWPLIRVAAYDPDLPDGEDDETLYGFLRNLLPDAPDPHSSGGST